MEPVRSPNVAMTVVAAMLLGAGATGACAASSVSAPPTATSPTAAAADDDVTMGLMEHHRNHHHGGVTLFIAMSLDTLGVSPEQHAAVEAIRIGLLAKMEPARVAEQKLMTVLADGLEAGTLDTATVDATVVRLTTAAAAVHDASADAINQLHDVLTAPQRGAIVDKVEAHWAVWRDANADETLQAKPAAGHLTALAADLDLTADQVDKVRSSLAEAMKGVPRLDPQEIATHLRAFADAFRGETFDGHAWAAASGANARLAGWGAMHMARFVEAVSPVLTPDQRAAFARRLREHAAHDPSAEASQ
jgi:Spy/CpxP family protein refolding chaperone